MSCIVSKQMLFIRRMSEKFDVLLHLGASSMGDYFGFLGARRMCAPFPLTLNLRKETLNETRIYRSSLSTRLCVYCFRPERIFPLHSSTAALVRAGSRVHDGCLGFPLYGVDLSVQLIAGLLLLVNRFVPLALVVLAAIITNILLYHMAMDPKGIGAGILVTILWLLVYPAYRASFRILFSAKPEPATLLA